MSVEYATVPKGNRRSQRQLHKCYSRKNQSRRQYARQLTSTISGASSIGPEATMAAVEAIFHLLPKHLARSKIVSLGDFGDFCLSLKNNDSEAPKQVTSDNIQSNHLRFRPGKEIRKIRNNIEFIKAA